MRTIQTKTAAEAVEEAQVEIGEKLDLVAERRQFAGSINSQSIVVYHRWAPQPEGIGTVTMPLFETACGLSINDCPMPVRLRKASIACGECKVTEAELEQANEIIRRHQARKA